MRLDPQIAWSSLQLIFDSALAAVRVFSMRHHGPLSLAVHSQNPYG
jgi:hypothetical protein